MSLLPLADPARRIHARTLEGALPALAMAISLAGGLAGSGTLVRAGGLLFLVASASVLAVNAVLLTTSGQTIGKRVLKLRVVRPDGSLPGGARAFVARELLFGLVALVPGLGAVVALVDAGLLLWSAERRTLHDLLADTIVVDERAAVTLEPPAASRAASALEASSRAARPRRR